MIKYPTTSQAISLWQESLTGLMKYATPKHQKEYIYHTTNVAISAYKIAQYCNIDPDTAYIVGLLHDYGRIQNEKESGISHFVYGYDEMIKRELDGVAKVCLSHSFPIKDFSFSDYTSYNEKDLIKAKQLLISPDYDCYDRLIQLCDMFFEGLNKVSYKQRINGIMKRYNLRNDQVLSLLQGAKDNKDYFDNLCGCNIYNILDIDE
jgi:hypothetical protein